jgi:polar amino acid transport system ATP-binding protein
MTAPIGRPMTAPIPASEGHILDDDVIAELHAGSPVEVLEAVDVHRRYGSHEVLRGVSFAIRRGEVKAILGPSGSGKSTLLRCLALLEPLDAGEIRMEGRTLGVRERDGRAGRLPEGELARQRSDIGMVFQRFNLFPHLTALGNVMLGLTEVRKTPSPEAKGIAGRMLDRVGLAHRAGFYPSELSGGQQQRVAIARALVSRPTVIFADEPTGNLDSNTSGEILDLMRHSVDEYGQTTVMFTHEALAAANADRILILDDGSIFHDLGRTDAHDVLRVMEELNLG